MLVHRGSTEMFRLIQRNHSFIINQTNYVQTILISL